MIRNLSLPRETNMNRDQKELLCLRGPYASHFLVCASNIDCLPCNLG